MYSGTRLSLILFAWYGLVTGQSKNAPSQTIHLDWQAQNSGITSSFRGISVVNAEVAWVSGSKGMYARTIDGGKTWRPDSVAGASSLDFRDVEAFDANMAILMSAGNGELSRIYRTTDGGKHWTLQYTNTLPTGFFDGMAFWDEKNGIVFGDPADGRLFIISTSDGGATWNRVPPENIPPVLPREYAFAASGTSITAQGASNVWIGTGGEAARVFRSTDRGKTWTVATTPIISGNESSGIFSLAFRDSLYGVAVGGDYKNPEQGGANVSMTTDGGLIWTLVKSSHSMRYRSAIAYLGNSLLPMFVAVGPSGSDFSVDGVTWQKLGDTGYHTLGFAKSANAGWAAGADGRIAKLSNDAQ